MQDIKVGDKVKIVEVNVGNWNYLGKTWDKYINKIGVVRKIENEGINNIFVEFQSSTLESSWWSRGELNIK